MAEIYYSDKQEELEKFLNMVAEVILQNNMSLYLGAGSSIQYNALNWNDLINSVYENYKNESNVDRAQYAELQGVDIKTEISKKISLLKIDDKKENTYLNYLLNFDYKSIWTTNYDQVIEKVLSKKSKSFKPIYKYSHFQDLSYPGGCFLFKINGSYNDPKTIVVTKEDFINYRQSHEAYLILLKRELLCHSFLFLGCSFEDDILRMCIKDILNCIENSTENFATKHFAVIVESNSEKLQFISKSMSRYYNIKCLNVSSPKQAYKVAYGLACRVKYNSIFISGAKKYVRHSEAEGIGKRLCQNLIGSFMKYTEFPFKFISGMGMSIGHFICGTVRQKCKNKNLNRYLQMEPFPFTNKEDNKRHRDGLINKAGIFIFIFGDLEEAQDEIENSGMWKEYIQAKKNQDNILIPLPCGIDSISTIIFKKELEDTSSFSVRYFELLNTFNYKSSGMDFFDTLVEKVILTTREIMDIQLNEISSALHFEK